MLAIDYSLPVTMSSSYDREMPIKENILLGQRLRNVRIQADLSQNKLAKNCNIALSYPHYIEKGEREPSLTVIRLWLDNCGYEMRMNFVPKNTEYVNAEISHKISPLVEILESISDKDLELVKALLDALPIIDDRMAHVIKTMLVSVSENLLSSLKYHNG